MNIKYLFYQSWLCLSLILTMAVILHSPWRTLGHVDTAIYGAPSSGITRRQVQY